MNKEKTFSCSEAGRMLSSAALKGIDYLVERLLPKIAEVLNLSYADYDLGKLRAEARYVCLWIATKALEAEKQELIESILESGLSGFEEEKQTDKRGLFYHRCDQYNEAWNEKSGGNQSILCINILAEMFTDGNHQRELVNFWAFIQIANFVLSLMKAIVDLRNEIKIEE